jgi:serine/threonine-protein kinase
VVIDTNPPPDSRHPQGTTVTLIVSRGQNLVTVPSVVGQQQADATTTLRNDGFKVAVQHTSSDQPEGEVTAQDPSGGSTAPHGSHVTITVSNGRGSVVVPNVVGQPQDSAEKALGSAGVTTVDVVKQTVTDQTQDGIVLDQSPPAGTRQHPDDTVTIFVGRFRQTTTTPTTPTTTPSNTTPTTP